MGTARTKLWNVKVSDEELAMLMKLAADAGEPASILFRRWLRERWIASGNAEATKASVRGKGAR